MCACKGRFVSQSGPPSFSQSVKSVSSCLSIILPDHFSLYHNCNFSSSSINGLIRHYKEPELLLAGSAMAVLFSLHATQDLMECLLFVATSEPLSKCIPNQFWETCCVQMNLSVTFEVMWIKYEYMLLKLTPNMTCIELARSGAKVLLQMLIQPLNFFKKGAGLNNSPAPLLCGEWLLLCNLVKLTQMVYYSIMVPLSCSGPFDFLPKAI